MVSKKYKSIVSIFQKHIQDNEISDGTKFFIDLANYFRKTIDKENHYLIDLNTNLFDDFLEAWIQKKPI